MKQRFNPIRDKSAEIIEWVMNSPEMPQDETILFKLRLAVEETVENVVRYAYNGGIGWLEVDTQFDADTFLLTIELRDAGKRFNPLERPDPNVSLSAEEREIGGLGIFLCKQMMDSVTYQFKDGCNVLTMQKRIDN